MPQTADGGLILHIITVVGRSVACGHVTLAVAPSPDPDYDVHLLLLLLLQIILVVVRLSITNKLMPQTADGWLHSLFYYSRGK
eukprot:11452864-Ditylum_brightwellii.AAC.1